MRNKYWFILFFLVLVVCGALFAFFYNGAKKEAIHNLNSNQLVIAEQTKKGIEQFFEFHVGVLSRTARNRHIIDLDDEGKRDMAVIYNTFSGDITGVTRMDETGRIMYVFPYDRKSIGVDISFRSHIGEIMETRRPVMSDVFVTAKNVRAVAIHVPVVEGDKFRGTIGFLIRFESIARQYLESIRIGDEGYAWLISKNGTELYCPAPGHIGRSVFESCKDFPSIITMAKKMTRGERGVTTYEYNMAGDKNTEMELRHAVYLPINAVNTYWSIVVATPDRQVLGAVGKFRMELAVIFGILVLFGIPSSYFGARAWKIIAEEKRREKAEEALRESEARYRTLFDSSVDSIFIVTPDLVLIDLNPAAVKLFGFSSRKEFMKRSAVLDSPEYQPDGTLSSVKAKKMVDIALEKGSHIFEWVHKKADGTEFPSTVLLSRMVVNGRVAIQSSVRDISDQKIAEMQRLEMEKKILHFQKMESLGQLAGGLAHALNNILTIIQTNLEIAAMEMGEGSEEYTPYENALEAVQKAADLTNQILAYAGKSVFPMVGKIDVNSVVEAGIELCSASVPENVSLAFNRGEHMPLTTADEGQVQQIVINLITNSSEAIGQAEGSIVVSTGVDDCDERRLEESRTGERPGPGPYIFIEVADTGCGMDEATKQFLFDPFYTTKFIGRGLGMPAVFGIVKKHNGAIFVKSSPGMGATVRVLLPF